MKYALITESNIIVEVSDQKYVINGEAYEQVEITDEQADIIETSTNTLFLIDGELISFSAKLWSEEPEKVKESLRYRRNLLLAQSDWTQFNDSPLSESERSAWAVYRQELRDLTDNIDENGKVEFPIAP